MYFKSLTIKAACHIFKCFFCYPHFWQGGQNCLMYINIGGGGRNFVVNSFMTHIPIRALDKGASTTNLKFWFESAGN